MKVRRDRFPTPGTAALSMLLACAAALCGCRELIHNHGNFFVKRGEWVHDKSKDAERIEAVFASLASA